jgi:DNA polymerase-3 subunit epsilon
MMTGGQSSLLDEGPSGLEGQLVKEKVKRVSADRPALKVIRCNNEELTAHLLRLEAIEKSSGTCIWNC